MQASMQALRSVPRQVDWRPFHWPALFLALRKKPPGTRGFYKTPYTTKKGNEMAFFFLFPLSQLFRQGFGPTISPCPRTSPNFYLVEALSRPMAVEMIFN
jgi:hypothetical protein